jgi:hypothetical protein
MLMTPRLRRVLAAGTRPRSAAALRRSTAAAHVASRDCIDAGSVLTSLIVFATCICSSSSPALVPAEAPAQGRSPSSRQLLHPRQDRARPLSLPKTPIEERLTMDSATRLPVVWFGIIGFGVLMYVLMDGFVLGIGILAAFAEDEPQLDQHDDTAAPIWDGNETWLVLGGAGCWPPFPRPTRSCCRLCTCQCC